MTHLTVDNVSRHFGSLEALKGVTFSVDEGEFFCLLGASSAGKTTTLRSIAGLEELHEGSVTFDGQDITHAPVQGRGMSMIFQTFALYPHLSIRANLGYPLVRDRVPKAEIRQRVGEVAELLRVTHTLDRKPNTLSGGEQQRVAIGRAIVRRPSLLLLDEPLTNLDAKLRHDMRAEFKRLHRELGMTMLYATPDQLEALTMGERIALIDDGRIVETGEPRDLYGAPSHTFVASMVGSPVINFVKGTVNSSATSTKLEIPFGELDLANAGLATQLNHGDAVTLGVRPHDLHINGNTPSAFQPDLALSGKVHLTEPLGDVTILDISVDDHVLKLVLPEEKAASYNVGQPIDLSFQLADAHLFMTDTGTRVN
ncbi:MAG: ABC transporter ATP-binding protein [Gammaproteobacteria bacterium]|nr:ABC transporter ATP-binding protein [Gammaproteobacteria bacterium]